MYTFVVLLVLALLGVLAYYLYVKQKGERLEQVERGVCPECGRDTIQIESTRSGGCSGTQSQLYRCAMCGYEEEFNVIGGCGGGCSR